MSFNSLGVVFEQRLNRKSKDLFSDRFLKEEILIGSV